MEDLLTLNLFNALDVDQKALSQLHYCWNQMSAKTDSVDASFYRQAFARAVFSYFIVGGNLLWADTRVSRPTAQKPPQNDANVLTSFMAVFQQHQEVFGKTTATITDQEQSLLESVETRLARLIYPMYSSDLTVSTNDMSQLTEAIRVLDRILHT